MSPRSPRFLIPILLCAVALAACSDDSTSPQPDSNVLVTFELNEFFMEAFADRGTVFASNAEGEVLDVATWDGPTTVVLKSTEVHPDTISFTFFRSNGEELELATEVGVPVGTIWTYSGTYFPAVSGSAEIDFVNVPEHESIWIAANWYRTGGPGQLPANWTIPIHGDSTDCYVRVDPLDATPVGGWLRGLHPGDAVSFDFNAPGTVAPLASTVVQLPPGGDRISYNVSVTVPSEPFRNVITVEAKNIFSGIPEAITIFAPPVDTANLNTMLYQSVGGDPSIGEPSTYHQQDSNGPIPGVFSHMEGDLSLSSTSPDSCSFATTSSWDRFVASWWMQIGKRAYWYVEGNAPIQAFALPELPEEVSAQNPDYLPHRFVLAMLEIIQDAGGGMVLSQGKSYPIITFDKTDVIPRGSLARKPANWVIRSSGE